MLRLSRIKNMRAKDWAREKQRLVSKIYASFIIILLINYLFIIYSEYVLVTKN